jgi:plasmid stability protein
MSKMVQIRNLPDRLHRILKSRAAMAGLSLSDYLIRELERSVLYPTLEEFRSRLASRRPVDTLPSTVEWIREERASR